MMRSTNFDVLLARFFIFALVIAGIWQRFYPNFSHDSLALLPCPFHALTGFDCPGCGMTRACFSLSRFDVLSAWHFHPLSFLLVAIALAWSVAPNFLQQRWNLLGRTVQQRMTFFAFALTLGTWLYRLMLPHF